MKTKPALLLTLFFFSTHLVTFAQMKTQFQLARGPGIKAGQPAPDVSFLDPSGKKVELSDYRGKIILLDVWATWCVPCIKGMPELNRLCKENSEDLVVLAVCTADDQDNFERFVGHNAGNYDFLFAFDPQGIDGKASEFRSIYAINGFPTTMVIDKNGTFVNYGTHTEEIGKLIKIARNTPFQSKNAIGH